MCATKSFIAYVNFYVNTSKKVKEYISNFKVVIFVEESEFNGRAWKVYTLVMSYILTVQIWSPMSNPETKQIWKMGEGEIQFLNMK